MPTDVERRELIELVGSHLDGLAEPSRRWAVDPAVCDRYLVCGECNGKPGAEATLPFLLGTARWRDEMVVHEMLTDEHLCAAELRVRSLLLYALSTDAKGRPLMIERCGAWDIPALSAFAAESAAELVRAHCLVNERIRIAVDALRSATLAEGAARPESAAEVRHLSCLLSYLPPPTSSLIKWTRFSAVAVPHGPIPRNRKRAETHPVVG